MCGDLAEPYRSPPGEALRRAEFRHVPGRRVPGDGRKRTSLGQMTSWGSCPPARVPARPPRSALLRSAARTWTFFPSEADRKVMAADRAGADRTTPRRGIRGAGRSLPRAGLRCNGCGLCPSPTTGLTTPMHIPGQRLRCHGPRRAKRRSAWTAWAASGRSERPSPHPSPGSPECSTAYVVLKDHPAPRFRHRAHHPGEPPDARRLPGRHRGG